MNKLDKLYEDYFEKVSDPFNPTVQEFIGFFKIGDVVRFWGKDMNTYDFFDVIAKTKGTITIANKNRGKRILKKLSDLRTLKLIERPSIERPSNEKVKKSELPSQVYIKIDACPTCGVGKCPKCLSYIK